MLKKHNISGSSVLDHLGLVAATIDKLGISKEIDKRLPLSYGSKTTHGQRVSANPVSKLLGGNVRAADFNDASLGGCLDAIHTYGITKLFSEVSLSIALKHKLLGRSVDLDTTTLSVYVAYDHDATPNNDVVQRVDSSAVSRENERLHLPTNPIPTHGYAKNKRFDLKQMTLLLATSGAANFPVWMESHSGNSSDQTTLEAAAKRMQNLCKQLASAPSFLYVGH